MEEIQGTVSRAIYSKDLEQIQQTEEFANLLKGLPETTRNEWNTNNTINYLAEKTNIGELLSELRGLIGKTAPGAAGLPGRAGLDVGKLQNDSAMALDSFFKKGNKDEDNTAKSKMFNVFDNALNSGNEEQIRIAAETLKRFQSVPQEVRERWDSANTVNPLADYNGIQALLEALNRLIAIEEKNGTMTITLEE